MHLTVRITLVLAIFLLLVLAGRTENALIIGFACGLVLGFIPTFVLIGLTLWVGAFAIMVLRRNKLVFVSLTALTSLQTVILLLWFIGLTAASLYAEHPATIGQPVIDPKLEHYLMVGYWLLAALVVAIFVDHLVHSLWSKRGREKNFYRARIGILLLVMFLLLCVQGSRISFARMAINDKVPSSVSPTGAYEIELVPMAAFFDQNGVVIARNGRSPIWFRVGEIGDLLTDAKSGRFAWTEDGSKAYLLLTFYDRKDWPAVGYDVKAGKHLEGASYRAGDSRSEKEKR